MKKVQIKGLDGSIIEETTFAPALYVNETAMSFVVLMASGRKAYVDRNNVMPHDNEAMMWVDVEYLKYY